MSKRVSIVLGILALALVAAPAAILAEGFQTFLGSTSVGAFFNRPSASCAATATSVRFTAQRFNLPQAATCNIYGAQDYDGYLHLYAGNFNSASPTTNCLTGNDDDTLAAASGLGIGASALRGLNLGSGFYTLVTSAFSNTSGNGGSGSFSNTIHCGSPSGSSPSLLNVQPRHGFCGISYVGIPDDQEICLQNNRFLVAINNISNSTTGLGTPVRTGSTDTGHFWFYNDRNWEVMVKVLNGCAINGFWWVFAGALTNQQYTINVADSSTLQVNGYTNPLGVRAAAVADTQAFPCP